MRVSVKIFFRITVFLAGMAGFSGCMSWDYGLDSSFEISPARGRVLFIVNEGNFQYGNASLSCYDIYEKTVEHEVFVRANDQKLGDVAQSMTIYGDRGWIVVNNSHVIFSIDPETFVEKGRITGLTSPRHIHFISERKAYVTQLWDSRIFIVDPVTYRVTGYIDTGMDDAVASTEQIVQYGDYVIVNCYSYQRKILKIDTRTDEITDELEVGLQPFAMELDCNGKLWVLADGGYPGNPAGSEPASLSVVDPDGFTVERRFVFYGDSAPAGLALTPGADTLYFINDGVWRMSVDSETLPEEPFIPSRGTEYCSVGVCPWNSDVYVADAIDWQQKGTVYRYSASGELEDEFRTGVAPGFFCWY